jgi:hypothetical protein
MISIIAIAIILILIGIYRLIIGTNRCISAIPAHATSRFM